MVVIGAPSVVQTRDTIIGAEMLQAFADLLPGPLECVIILAILVLLFWKRRFSPYGFPRPLRRDPATWRWWLARESILHRRLVNSARKQTGRDTRSYYRLAISVVLLVLCTIVVLYFLTT